jgi:hypothetical protein
MFKITKILFTILFPIVGLNQMTRAAEEEKQSIFSYNSLRNYSTPFASV